MPLFSLNTEAQSGNTKPVALGGKFSLSVAAFTMAGSDASELRDPMPSTCAGTMAFANVANDTRQVTAMTPYNATVGTKSSVISTMK